MAQLIFKVLRPNTNFPKIRLRTSRLEDLEVVRDLLIDGFWDNPGMALIDLHDNIAAERHVYTLIAKLMIGAGSQLILYGDEIIGHVNVMPPGAKVVPPFWDVLSVGWTMPFKFGLGFTLKFIDFLNKVDEQTNTHLGPYQPAVMLEWFTVKSEWRGRGIGIHVTNEYVTKSQERVVLITENEACVRLYKRAGFEIIEKHLLRTGYGRECESWCMVYNAPTHPPTTA